MKIDQIQALLRQNASPQSTIKTFFKTGSGQYAENDKFIGISVPKIRTIAKDCKNLSYIDIATLLESKFNEERLLALIILTERYKKADDHDKEEIYQFYMQHVSHVNNWNLVDASAHLIIGAHLWDKDKNLLINLAQSKNMWKRRIAIVSTWYFIRKHNLEWTFNIARILLKDTHDLIHKAVGWMLREAGKKNKADHITFLDEHAIDMPRTMLRYSIEKLPEDIRTYYLLKK